MPTQASSLTPFGLSCRSHRMRAGKTIGDQADFFRISPSEVSLAETAARPPSAEYLQKFCEWLHLGELDLQILRKMISYTEDKVVRLPLPKEHREARRLFRKINKLTLAQIRDLGRDDGEEISSDRRLTR